MASESYVVGCTAFVDEQMSTMIDVIEQAIFSDFKAHHIAAGLTHFTQIDLGWTVPRGQTTEDGIQCNYYELNLSRFAGGDDELFAMSDHIYRVFVSKTWVKVVSGNGVTIV